MIKVLIVEDDPMVADLNRRYLESIDGFKAAGTVPSVKEAKRFLEKNDVELVLLDVYMPGETGLELLPYIRQKDKKADVILITAATDIDTVQQALRFGTFDYLIKPFTFSRFKEAILSYQDKVNFVKQHHTLNQQELDMRLFQKDTKKHEQPNPKGLTKNTLKVVLKELEGFKNKEFSTEELAVKTGITRVSVRKYLNFLEETGILSTRVCYGTIGRPIIMYSYQKNKASLISDYL
ncbi:MAG TPA: two-component system response regulator DcuR [Bacillus bacterium]|nr:two-component system response regulator DcuR [Bacillus sp. (in: firmicutes)]